MNETASNDVLQIQQLKVDYAIATDAIASGQKHVGLSLYRATFTPDARISAGFDPAAPDVAAVGPDAWADACEVSFAPFLGAHHLLGGIGVRVDADRDDRASMTAYLRGTMLAAEGNDVTKVLGTYHDVVVRRDGRWQITESFLHYFSIESGSRLAP